MAIKRLAALLLVVGIVTALSSCTCFLCPRLDETRHIARKGDTLGKIAVTYYGSKEKVDLLLEANPKLDAGRPLMPGQLVHIPYTN